MMSPKPYDVVIVGGGLSGLLVAHQLQLLQQGMPPNKKSWRLLEARPTLGGRLENDAVGNDIDLGGAWIWPMHQPRISNLVKSLGINTFAQPDDPSSTRIEGGAVEFVKRIAKMLPSDHIQTSSPVVGCKRVPVETNDTCTSADLSQLVTIQLESGEEINTKHVVLAAPPKLVSKHITFDPPLASDKARAMEKSQTWMAGVTKVALVYNSPRFWPLSISNGGFYPGPNRPAFQVYDGSPEDDTSVSALTFFTLSSLSNAAPDDDATLARHCAEQMTVHLSSNSRDYVPDTVVQKITAYDSFHVKRWPMEKYISEDVTPKRVNPHPEPVPALAKSEWDGQILFAGTETDLSSPGVMEGAVGAAMRVVDELKKLWQ